MTNTKNIFVAIAISAVAIFSSLVVTATAQVSDTAVNQAAITYPIAALGGCTDKADCKAFCSKAENMTACVSFAEQRGLLKGEDLRVSKIVAEKIAKKETPGGCTTKAECESYCQGNVEHLNACVSFGEQLGVIPQKDLAEAKKIAQALANGAKMPGSCKTKNDCENYCAAGAHIDECLSFAEAAGMLSPEDLAQAKKVAPFLKNGETPGKCQTKAECDAYCAIDANFSECVGFAEKAGFVSSEEAAMAKKVGGKGPGGCKGKDACQAYCNDTSHADECLNFAKDKGLLTPDQLDKINNGIDKLKSGLEQVPPEVRDQVTACLEGKIGKDRFAQVMAKQATLTQGEGDQIQGCFANIGEMMKNKMMDKAGANGAPAGFGRGEQGGGTTPPSKEDIMKNLPDNIPPDMRANIEDQINKQIDQMPKGVPTNMVPPSSGAPKACTMEAKVCPDGSSVGRVGPNCEFAPCGAGSVPSAGAAAPQVGCNMFEQIPSCDLIPAGQGRDACLKCKQ